MIDQKIEGALKTQRQSSTQEMDTLAAQQQQRLNQLQEECEAEQTKTSAAICRAAEERHARTLAEAEAQRALSSETAKVAHIQSSLTISLQEGRMALKEVEEQKKKCAELKESAAAARRELHEAKESLATATVSQRLLRAYKAEKQRCQTDLDDTLRAFSAPAWQAEQTMEELEKSTKSILLSLESLQAVLAGSRRRRIQPSPTRNSSTDTPVGSGASIIPAATKRSREASHTTAQTSPQENAAVPKNMPAAHVQASSSHGQPGLRCKAGGEEQGRVQGALPTDIAETWLLAASPLITCQEAVCAKQERSTSEARGRVSAPGNSSTAVQKTLPLPTIPKKAKTDKAEVIHHID